MNTICVRASVVAALGATVAGCGAPMVKPSGISPDQSSAMRHRGISPPAAFDSEMIEVTRTDSVVSTAGKVLGMLGGMTAHFGGRVAYSPMNLQGYGAWMSKADMTNLDGPASAAAMAVKHTMRSVDIPVTKESDFRMVVSADRWGLRYLKMGSDQYQFVYSLEFRLLDAGELLRVLMCGGAVKQTFVLDDWLSAHGEKLHQAEARIGDKCARDALVAFGLVDAAFLEPGPVAKDGISPAIENAAAQVSARDAVPAAIPD